MKMTWILIASALGLLEISTANLVCLWFIGGAIGGFVASYFTESVRAQLLVFVLVSCVVLVITRPLAKKVNQKPRRTNSDALIGKTAVVTEQIAPYQEGRVKVDGLSWMASSDTELQPGRKVVITRISGVTLAVKPQE